MLEEIQPIERRIWDGPLFREMAAGTLSMPRFRAALLYFYPLVENFPMYMAGAIQKIPPGDDIRSEMARDWLMSNMNTERRHAAWFRQWAIDFGVNEDEFIGRVLPPVEMDAINNYLWQISQRGSLPECIGAINYGIEGPTGIWSQILASNLSAYDGKSGVKFSKGTTFWVKAHSVYDDKHAPEALELMKNFAETDELIERTIIATKRAMEYYAMAADACYAMFD